MSASQDFRVTPMSWDDVDAVAVQVRDMVRCQDQPYFHIVDLLEKVLPQAIRPPSEYNFEVGGNFEMGTAEGLTCPNGKFIRIREDVYMDACDGKARPRFTMAHELGHYLLHTGQNQPLARAMPGEKLRAFESAEKQADRFAGTLLMPRHLIHGFDTEVSVAQRFGVSRAAARVRLDKISKEGPGS